MKKVKRTEPYKYIIEKGDTLYDIARVHMDDPDKWRIIYSYNCEVIGLNPHRIEIGTAIIIPIGRTNIQCYMVEEQYLRNLIGDEGCKDINKLAMRLRLMNVQDKIIQAKVWRIASRTVLLLLGLIIMGSILGILPW